MKKKARTKKERQIEELQFRIYQTSRAIIYFCHQAIKGITPDYYAGEIEKYRAEKEEDLQRLERLQREAGRGQLTLLEERE